MSEFRQDRTSGDWVLIAPERNRRPGSWTRVAAPAAAPRFDPGCPFCPGNEDQLPGILEEQPAESPPGWRTRVVPNRHPLLRPDAPACHGIGDGIGDGTGDAREARLPGRGHHEVIIESPRHDLDPARLPGPDLAALVRTYAGRCRALLAQPGVETVVLFRNHDRAAGASLVHPHAQVVASSVTPPRLAAARDWARARHARSGRCATCEELERELRDGRRIVEATEHFLVLVPFAARGPFELWLAPRRHEPCFGRAGDGELLAFGDLLQRTLRRLGAVLGEPAYNFVVACLAAPEDAASSHWGLRILPGLTTPGGFELGTGLAVNPSLPESDAETLRRATLPAPPADG